MEMAHRLSLLPGKCQQVHGHSWWVTLEIRGDVDKNGIILEFAEVKKEFRLYLDTHYDHRLLVNHSDPIFGLEQQGSIPAIPGLQYITGDPTTENVAQAIYLWAKDKWGQSIPGQGSVGRKFRVEVWETSVNCAERSDW